METSAHLAGNIFNIESEEQFNRLSIEIFRSQYSQNDIYGSFCRALKIDPYEIKTFEQIPFLPIEFFKHHEILSVAYRPDLVFTSSGTTGHQTSRHYVHDSELYRKSFCNAFRYFFGNPSEYHILALLPGYLERTGSSLIYMVNELIKLSKSNYSGFYLNELSELRNKIETLKDRKILLIGVSFALLDMVEKFPVTNPALIVMETGGMKGRRKELVRSELHSILKKGFGTEKIYSEYGMTELLSQAYSKGEGIFHTPPWMKILIRETNDPLSLCKARQIGGINVIDLANMYSCSFIATQDLGKIYQDGSFEVSGRFDNCDIRGCNLLIG
jgi:phenylacetate-coenzyme A ligase PaaK-like adenylate-forming protein